MSIISSLVALSIVLFSSLKMNPSNAMSTLASNSKAVSDKSSLIKIHSKIEKTIENPTVSASKDSVHSISSENIQKTKKEINDLIKKNVKAIKKNLNIKEKPKMSPFETLASGIETEIQSLQKSAKNAEDEVVVEVAKSWKSLSNSLSGVKLDTLFLLIGTSIIVPLFRYFNTSPIIGFLITGMLVGPTGMNWVKDIHMIDVLGTNLHQYATLTCVCL